MTVKIWRNQQGRFVAGESVPEGCVQLASIEGADWPEIVARTFLEARLSGIVGAATSIARYGFPELTEGCG